MRPAARVQHNVTATEIEVQRRSRALEVAFDNGQRFRLPWEYLRVYSPSAEVRGHGAGDAVLQVGKENVILTAIQPVGQYAVRLIFDDGHDSGLYSWDLLYELGANQERYWRDYQDALAAAGHRRRPEHD